MPINILEIRAVRLALIAWTFRLRNSPARIQSDNATAVGYTNHQGGTRSHAAQREVDYILSWAEKHVPCLSAVYIPGVENWQADFLSHQQLLPGEWSLHPNVFLAICQRWGTPVVDLLAPRFNKKLDNCGENKASTCTRNRCVNDPMGTDFTDLCILSSIATTTAAPQDKGRREAGNLSSPGMAQKTLVCRDRENGSHGLFHLIRNRLS